MLKRVDLGNGRFAMRNASSQRMGPIDSYQTKQFHLREQAERRGKLADKIRQNIELTLSLSDNELMRFNRHTYEFYHTKNTTDPVLKKLARMEELRSEGRKSVRYDWERFGGNLGNFTGYIGDFIRGFRQDIEDRKMKEDTYEFLRKTPMTQIFDSLIVRAKDKYAGKSAS